MKIYAASVDQLMENPSNLPHSMESLKQAPGGRDWVHIWVKITSWILPDQQRIRQIYCACAAQASAAGNWSGILPSRKYLGMAKHLVESEGQRLNLSLYLSCRNRERNWLTGQNKSLI
jgi:hypothetical protein